MVLHLYQKKLSPLYAFEDKDAIKESQFSTKSKVHFNDTFSRRTYFWNKTVPRGSKNSHNVVQLNPDKDKYYPLYHTLHSCISTNFHQKALEPLPVIPIMIYNQSAYTVNQTFTITFEHNNFKNYSQKWTQFKDNP